MDVGAALTATILATIVTEIENLFTDVPTPHATAATVGIGLFDGNENKKYVEILNECNISKYENETILCKDGARINEMVADKSKIL